jgi:hypothetical protein
LSQSEREETSGYETFRENDDEDAVSYLGKWRLLCKMLYCDTSVYVAALPVLLLKAFTFASTILQYFPQGTSWDLLL